MDPLSEFDFVGSGRDPLAVLTIRAFGEVERGDVWGAGAFSAVFWDEDVGLMDRLDGGATEGGIDVDDLDARLLANDVDAGGGSLSSMRLSNSSSTSAASGMA